MQHVKKCGYQCMESAVTLAQQGLPGTCPTPASPQTPVTPLAAFSCHFSPYPAKPCDPAAAPTLQGHSPILSTPDHT